MKHTTKNLLPLALITLVLLNVSHSPAGDLSGLEAELVIGGLQGITAVAHAGDERLFVVLKTGIVILYEAGDVRDVPFLDITDRVRSGGERGLLSIAFHPDFAVNGRVFVHYTNAAGDSVLSRFTVRDDDPDRADPASEQILLEIAQPFANHNGGQLQFGLDGLLYVGTGDGGSSFDPLCQAQDGSSLLGKILRLDVDAGASSPPFHSIPPGNPFVDDPRIRDEIWSLGLRNPWRFSFDRTTGDLYIGDVGQSAREEINFQPAASPGGENYGWKALEGTLCTSRDSGCGFELLPCDDPRYTAPVIEYDHGDGRCAVTGGYVYRGAALARLAGSYVYGDFCSGDVWAASRRGDGGFEVENLGLRLPDLTTFGEDAAGELYIAAGPRLYRLVDPGSPGGGDDCSATETTLCLQGNRFAVTIEWRTSRGERGVGRGGEFSVDTGWFYFFDRRNIEAVIKVLDGCAINEHFWVFAAGLTDVEATLVVRDTVSGEERTWRNRLGEPFQPVQDTAAFATCP